MIFNERNDLFIFICEIVTLKIKIYLKIQHIEQNIFFFIHSSSLGLTFFLIGSELFSSSAIGDVCRFSPSTFFSYSSIKSIF